jgi:4-diphosphocytidyl-2-C-methyl-D-erythritol kinase
LRDVPAPAKLNLFLHIIGRRTDGYHLLQSTFALIDWCDTLHFELRDDGLLRRHDLGLVLPEDDLCLRAARALSQASGTPFGVDIGIDKQIPWCAGLGGGSSDAASTLIALNRLWGLHWPLDRLLKIGLTLGADVPFFIAGHNAFVEGIGERLTPVRVPAAMYAVVKPASNASTPEIFRSPHVRRDTAALSGPPVLTDVAGNAEAFGHNDLQPAAELLYPDIAQAVEWLRGRFGNARMSGSGSAAFARVGQTGQPLQADLDDLPTGSIGRICQVLPRHPLAAWIDELQGSR